MEAGTESARDVWSAPQCPFPIEYSKRAFDNIRLAVVDAFFSLPRGGAEIGGILLGKWEQGRLSVLESAALDCEHALGPSFTLSEADHGRLAELVAAAGQHTSGLRPVGWYHSHTRSEIFLSDADLAIHKRYFPEPWQVALVFKPHTFRPMRCGFFFREPDGSMRGESSVQEFELAPLAVAPAARGSRPRPMPSHEHSAAPPEQTSAPKAEPEARDPLPLATPVEVIEPAVPAAIPAAVPATESWTIREAQGSPEQLALPYDDAVLEEDALVNEIPEEPDTQESQWRGMRAMVAAAVLLALAVAGFESRYLWFPQFWSVVQPLLPAPAPPPLGLSAAESNGALQIRWDGGSPAVRNAIGGVLQITDGGPASRHFKLDKVLLNAGMFIYARQTEKVDVALVVDQPDGQQVREMASFLGEPPPGSIAAPSPDPQRRLRNQTPDDR